MTTILRPDQPNALTPPPLQHGDRLSAEEYERRYDAMPGLKKAELINGVVYMPSPVSFDDHAGPHFDLICWLGYYRMLTPGVRGGDNGALRLPLNNRPQPDAFLMILPSHGGNVQIDEQRYVVGAPELVAEVAASSASYDLHDKLDVYKEHGVREYLVWRVLNRAIDWYVNRGGAFEKLAVSTAGTLQSEALPGLWLDPAALIAGDMPRVLHALNEGLACPAHADFVRRLQEAQAATSNP